MAGSGRSSPGPASRERIRTAWAGGGLAVCSISFWEVAMLSTRGRITLHQAPGSWRLDWLQAALEEIVVDGALALAAVQLEAFHADPTDRFILAAALARGATLLTADRAILAWPGPHPHKSTLTHPLSRLGHGKAPAKAGAF